MALDPDQQTQPFAPNYAGELKAPGPAVCVPVPGVESDDLQCFGPKPAPAFQVPPPSPAAPPKFFAPTPSKP